VRGGDNDVPGGTKHQSVWTRGEETPELQKKKLFMSSALMKISRGSLDRRQGRNVWREKDHRQRHAPSAASPQPV